MAEISDHLADESVTIWLDLRDPGRDDLAVLSDEFGLHPLAVEDAVHEHQRPKLDRYRSHLFLIRWFDTRQASLDHEIHSWVHVGRYDGLTGVSRRPYSQQLIHETLANICHPAEIDFESVEIGIQPIQESPRFTT